MRGYACDGCRRCCQGSATRRESWGDRGGRQQAPGRTVRPLDAVRPLAGAAADGGGLWLACDVGLSVVVDWRSASERGLAPGLVGSVGAGAFGLLTGGSILKSAHYVVPHGARGTPWNRRGGTRKS